MCGSLIAVGFVGAMLYMVLSFKLRAGTLEQALPLTFSESLVSKNLKGGKFLLILLCACSDIATSMWLCTQASVDIIITVALVMCLKKAMVSYTSAASTFPVVECLANLQFYSGRIPRRNGFHAPISDQVSGLFCVIHCIVCSSICDFDPQSTRAFNLFKRRLCFPS